MDRHLAELIPYGGELWSRRDVIRDLKRCGLDDRCVDRYLQGNELAQRRRQQHISIQPLTPLIQ